MYSFISLSSPDETSATMGFICLRTFSEKSPEPWCGALTMSASSMLAAASGPCRASSVWTMCAIASWVMSPVSAIRTLP